MLGKIYKGPKTTTITTAKKKHFYLPTVGYFIKHQINRRLASWLLGKKIVAVRVKEFIVRQNK